MKLSSSFFFFLGAHMFIFSLILVGFCFCSFFFFLENNFGLISYAIFFSLIKCPSIHSFFLKYNVLLFVYLKGT